MTNRVNPPDYPRPVPIAFIIDQLGVGGTERQLATLLQELDPNLFKPILITIHEYEICFDVPGEKHLFKTRKLLSVNALLNIFRIASLLRRERVRIVQTFFFDAAIMGVLAARLARVPAVILSRRDMGFWHTPLRLAMMKLLNSMSDRLLVNSESVRRRILQSENVTAKKIDLIYNGISPVFFNGEISAAEAKQNLGIEADSPVVGILANFNRDVKRVDLFLDSADLVRKRFPRVRFVIAGEGHLRPKLEERSRELSLNGVVKFIGTVTSVPSLLKAFDIGINCSSSEGLSNAVIEYMAAGVPVVVSDIPGNCELVEDGIEGRHFPSGDAVSLAERVGALLEDPRTATEMGNRGRKKALERFSAESMVRLHANYFSKLLWARFD